MVPVFPVLGYGAVVLGMLKVQVRTTVDSQSWNMDRGRFAGVPSSEAFGVGGQSHSTFLASTVNAFQKGFWRPYHVGTLTGYGIWPPN